MCVEGGGEGGGEASPVLMPMPDSQQVYHDKVVTRFHSISSIAFVSC